MYILTHNHYILKDFIDWLVLRMNSLFTESGYEGLMHRSSHRTQRDKCLNLLAKVYHNLYLHTCTKMVQ